VVRLEKCICVSVGRPRCGEINAERLRCKFRYKQAIKAAANEAEQCMNDDLFSHLCSKDTVSFGKSWRKRFRSRNVQPTNVLNGKSGDDILPEFTNFYKDVLNPTHLMLMLNLKQRLKLC